MRKIHRAWYMLVGCCLLQGGCMGLINNCRGIFFSPVVEDLGFTMGAFTSYVLVSGLFTAAVMPLAGKAFERIPCRILLSVMSVLFCVSVAVMGLLHSIPGFYAAAVLQGITSAFLMFYPAPLILGNWFKKRSGFAIGCSSACAGVIGILCNPLGNAIIQNYGWRTGYFAFGAACLLSMLPVSLFLLRLRPADVGLLPYGAEDPDMPATASAGDDNSLPAKFVLHARAFHILLIPVFLVPLVGSMNSHLSPMCVYLGYGAAAGATLTSFSFAGNVLSKFILGPIYDRFGLKPAIWVGCGFPAVGLLLLMTNSLPVRMIGALLFGFSMGMANIMGAIIVKDVYGLRLYSQLLIYSTLLLTLGNALSNPLTGFAVDAFGPARGYNLSLWVCFSIMVISFFCYRGGIRRGRKLVQDYQPTIST